jgi:uncharacterized protein (TIGR02117 family)
MKTLKKTFKIILKTLLGFILFLLVYALSAVGLSKITVNTDALQKQEVTIYIKTNGVHTDIVVPIKNEIKDWTNDIKYQQTKAKDSVMNYLAFGWGDKGFYLETPEWSDLKASIAFKAATGLSTSAMHTTFYKNMAENESCKEIKISKENYQKLINYILNSFQKDANQSIVCISGKSYGKNDIFYEANGSYSLFFTCNTWANSALKAANQKAAFWTPYDGGIFCHYK